MCSGSYCPLGPTVITAVVSIQHENKSVKPAPSGNYVMETEHQIDDRVGNFFSVAVT